MTVKPESNKIHSHLGLTFLSLIFPFLCFRARTYRLIEKEKLLGFNLPARIYFSFIFHENPWSQPLKELKKEQVVMNSCRNPRKNKGTSRASNFVKRPTQACTMSLLRNPHNTAREDLKTVLRKFPLERHKMSNSGTIHARLALF